MSRVQDQVLGHADEADGIEEYDNRLPTWWLGLFYFCIGWGVIYAIHYHFVGDRSQAGAYAAEIDAANQQWPAPEQGALVATTDADRDAGKAIFTQNCVACHGPELKGGIGPDLTDGEWIHGGTLADITRTITEGVPDKGMLTWGPILGPQKIAQVSAYVFAAGGGVEGDPQPVVPPEASPDAAPGAVPGGEEAAGSGDAEPAAGDAEQPAGDTEQPAGAAE